MSQITACAITKVNDFIYSIVASLTKAVKSFYIGV